MNEPMSLARVAMTAMVTGFMIAGCSAAGGGAVRSAATPEQGATAGADKAAIAGLEANVAAKPDDADARVRLAQAYAGAGRLMAARQAFADAVALGDTSTRAVIGLALGEVATGRPEAAIALIEAHRDTLPASDAGLALALAGDTQRAVLVLSDVARDPDAGARARQNLALALALDGQWAHARLIAAQDLAPEPLRVRMIEWSRLATPGDGAARVASILRVKSVSGEGMPARLALGDHPAVAGGATRMASFDPAPLRTFAPPPPPEMVERYDAPSADPASLADEAAAPEPVRIAAVEAAAPVTIAASAKPYRVRPATPDRLVVARVKLSPPRAVGARPAGRTAASARVVAAFDTSRPNGWAIQIGAYESLAVGKAGWARAKARHPALAAYPASSHTVRLGDRLFHRLTINGLPSKAAAQAQCRTLVARGGSCFVRAMAGTEAIRWASVAPSVAKPRATRIALR